MMSEAGFTDECHSITEEIQKLCEILCNLWHQMLGNRIEYCAVMKGYTWMLFHHFYRGKHLFCDVLLDDETLPKWGLLIRKH